MREFLRRLKTVGEGLAAIILVLVLLFGATCVFVFFPIVKTILAVIVYGVLSVLIIAVIILFVNWLFVEPFRKGRAK